MQNRQTTFNMSKLLSHSLSNDSIPSSHNKNLNQCQSFQYASYIDVIDEDAGSACSCPSPPTPCSPQSSSVIRRSISTQSTLASQQYSPKSPPPPPPPLPTPIKEQTYEKRIERQTEIAKRFYEYVILMKCLCNWNEYSMLRKRMIGHNKQLLKIILFKWVTYVEEAQSRRKGLVMLKRFIDKAIRKSLHHGIKSLFDHSVDCKLIEKMFLSWLEKIRLVRRHRMVKEYHVRNELILSKTCFYFQNWKIQSSLQTMIDHKRESFLRRILRQWNIEAKTSRLDWIRKIEEVRGRVHDGRIDLMIKMFQFMVSNTYSTVYIQPL